MGQINLLPTSPSLLSGYLAPEGFNQDLKMELEMMEIEIVSQHDRLFICRGAACEPAFAEDVWKNVEIVTYSTISNAAQLLKPRAKRWSHYSFLHHRRGSLILEKLPSVKIKRYAFLEEISREKNGVFTLLSETQMIFSPETRCPLPFGKMEFIEDKTTPPSRAYLKLWELFTLYQFMPKAGMKTIDMGSSPGGWTWVLQTIGTHVLSVDKALLDPKISLLPNVEFKKESAFSLQPQDIGPVDWFFSDIICYPEKLLELVMRFKESGLVQNFVCTIKFQNPTDFETLFKFKKIPGSKIIHLSCNKHEVTWINLKDGHESIV